MRSLHSLVIMMMAFTGLTASAAEMLKPGDPFPAWSLKDQTGATVKSTDLRGKTYLLWYFPKAMTSGCTREGCELRDNYAGFQKASIVILGISFDDPGKNAEFIAKNHFPFSLLSDSDKSLAIQVGAADSTSRIVARRISYLVGPDGKVLKAYPDVDPATHAKQVLADLAEPGQPK
jgi:thioredoxin-dependent peroxiredoxin